MKIIKPSFKIIGQAPGIGGMYKQIEMAGRTCYKSEDKITEDSAKEFVDRMIKSGHGAMLEHGTIYLHSTGQELKKYYSNKYSIVKYFSKNHVDEKHRGNDGWYVTTNLRVLVENDWMDDLQYLCEPTEYHERRITVKFVCDRGVSHEFVRHKMLCVA